MHRYYLCLLLIISSTVSFAEYVIESERILDDPSRDYPRIELIVKLDQYTDGKVMEKELRDLINTYIEKYRSVEVEAKVFNPNGNNSWMEVRGSTKKCIDDPIEICRSEGKSTTNWELPIKVQELSKDFVHPFSFRDTEAERGKLNRYIDQVVEDRFPSGIELVYGNDRIQYGKQLFRNEELDSFMTIVKEENRAKISESLDHVCFRIRTKSTCSYKDVLNKYQANLAVESRDD